MRKRSVIGLGIVGILFILPIFVLAIPQVTHTSFPFEAPRPSISWDLESYYNYTGPKIPASKYSAFAFPRVYIDEDEPMYNWSTWSSYPWLTGSGTEEDPYVIENLLIDAQGDGSCLWIYNSTKHFIIRQCYFANTSGLEFDNGVMLVHAKNGEIYGNIIDYCKTGFFISYGCSNITIYRNFMRATKGDYVTMRAFYSESGAYNIIFRQNLIINYEQLVLMFDCDDVTIDGNFMNNTEYEEYPNSVVGIIGSSNVRFRENIFTDNFKWFKFDVSEVDCANNTITGNSVITDLSSVEIPTPLSIGPTSGIHTAQSSSSIMVLTSTTDSQVVNNHIYQPGGAIIPGFEPFIVLATIGITGIILSYMVIRKKRKLEYTI